MESQQLLFVLSVNTTERTATFIDSIDLNSSMCVPLYILLRSAHREGTTFVNREIVEIFLHQIAERVNSCQSDGYIRFRVKEVRNMIFLLNQRIEHCEKSFNILSSLGHIHNGVGHAMCKTENSPADFYVYCEETMVKMQQMVAELTKALIGVIEFNA